MQELAQSIGRNPEFILLNVPPFPARRDAADAVQGLCSEIQRDICVALHLAGRA